MRKVILEIDGWSKVHKLGEAYFEGNKVIVDTSIFPDKQVQTAYLKLAARTGEINFFEEVFNKTRRKRNKIPIYVARRKTIRLMADPVDGRSFELHGREETLR